MLVNPAAARIGKAVKVGHIRFDIQQRCAIHDIHMAKVDRIAFDSVDGNDRQTDVIGAMRGSAGKHSMVLRFEKRLRRDFDAVRTVEVVEQERMTESAEILQSRDVLGGKNRTPLRLRFEAALNWDVRVCAIWAMNYTDGLDRNLLSHRSPYVLNYIAPYHEVELRFVTV